MLFPTPYSVGVHRRLYSTVDDYGRDVPAFFPARDVPGDPVRVHGWGSPRSLEPKLAGHDRVVVELELFAPVGTSIGPHDLVDLPDGQFEVVGHPEDHSCGPFAPGVGGLVINLRRVEG